MSTWRRIHGDYVTCVRHLPGDVYVVEAIDQSRAVHPLDGRFETLLAAQASADDQLRRRFQHRCSIDHCSGWIEWMA